MNRERRGELYLVGYAFIFSLFPIIANFATKKMPPLFFAGTSLVVTGIALFLFLALTREIFRGLSRKTFLYILGNTLFNVIFAFTFIFIGTSKTSGINTSLLIQTELFFAFFIGWIFFKEAITKEKIVGALFILIGAIAILYNGTFRLNLGDLLIMAGTVFYPFGNRFSKKAIEHVSPSLILAFRSMIAGPVLLLISLFFETYHTSAPMLIREFFWLILVNGVFLFGFAKIMWFRGLKELDITKSTAIVMASPGISLIYAFFFLREIPTLYQLLGFLVILAGLLVITRTKILEIETA